MDVDAPTDQGDPALQSTAAIKALEDIVSKIVSSDGDGKAEHVAQLAAAGMATLSSIRTNFVQSCYKVEDLKKKTGQLKSSYEESSLTLENVRYEKGYYERLISANMDCQSAFQDDQIALRPEAEFEERLSAEDRQTIEDASNREHAIMLQRLKQELEERKSLKSRLEQVQAEKKQLQGVNDKKKRKLDKMLGEVNSIRQSATPALRELGLEQVGIAALDSNSMQHMLPKPLYILFSQLAASNEVFSLGCKVTVTQTEARSEGRERKSRKAARTLVPDLNDVYRRDPCLVNLEVASEEGGPSAILVTFSYLPALNIITASSTDAASFKLIDSLYPYDDGLSWPHDVSTTAQESEQSLNITLLPGKPYRWCQHLGGLDILLAPPTREALDAQAQPPQPDADLPKLLARYRRERRAVTLLRRLKQRRRELATLMAHLDSLAKLQLPDLPASVQALFVSRTLARIVSWMAAQKMSMAPSSLPSPSDPNHQEDGEVPDTEEGETEATAAPSPDDTSLKTRGVLLLHVGSQDSGLLVEVDCTFHLHYPLSPSLLKVQSVKPAQAPAAPSILSQSQIAVLEGQLNVDVVDLCADDPLPTQLEYLCQCGDALAEAQRANDLASKSPLEFLSAQLSAQGRVRMHGAVMYS